MRVLVLHNTYQIAGGEDSVVQAEHDLLTDAGHEIITVKIDNAAVSSFPSKVTTALSAPYSQQRAAWTKTLIAGHRPDVVHVHNFFPLLTPAVHQAAATEGVAVVQTLHNYRLVCAGAMFYRNGHVCEKCLSGSNLWGVVHRCYRGSFVGSASVVAMQRRAARHHTWSKYVDRFIALSEFGRTKFAKLGLPSDRIVVKPNFAPPNKSESIVERRGALFVGRISHEKGLDVLLAAWQQLPRALELTIVGDGPDRASLSRPNRAGVTFVGQKTQSEVRELMRQAACLIVPSKWYEGFPMVVAEAFAAGLPVIASNVGALAEIVVPKRNGCLFISDSPTDLARTIDDVVPDSAQIDDLSRGAKWSYDTYYSPEVALRRLEQIYHEAIDRSRHRMSEPDDF